MKILDYINDISSGNIDYVNNLSTGISVKEYQSKAKVAKKFTDRKVRVGITKTAVKEIQEYRVSMGLKELNLKIRQCLRCYNKFHSNGPHNRICEKCKNVQNT